MTKYSDWTYQQGARHPYVRSTAGTDTWTVPYGTKFIQVSAMAGGGGGGGGIAQSSFSYRTRANKGGGGGGGAGGHAINLFFKVKPRQVLNITVGSGGAGGIGYKFVTSVDAPQTVPNPAITNGGKGGDTSIEGLVTLTGGEGGKYYEWQSNAEWVPSADIYRIRAKGGLAGDILYPDNADQNFLDTQSLAYLSTEQSRLHLFQTKVSYAMAYAPSRYWSPENNYERRGGEGGIYLSDYATTPSYGFPGGNSGYVNRFGVDVIRYEGGTVSAPNTSWFIGGTGGASWYGFSPGHTSEGNGASSNIYLPGVGGGGGSVSGAGPDEGKIAYNGGVGGAGYISITPHFSDDPLYLLTLKGLISVA
jgi:hypothetical protein